METVRNNMIRKITCGDVTWGMLDPQYGARLRKKKGLDTQKGGKSFHGDISPQPVSAPTFLHQVGKTPRQTQPATRPGAQKTTTRQQITQDNTPTDLTHTTPDEISLYTPHPIHTID